MPRYRINNGFIASIPNHIVIVRTAESMLETAKVSKRRVYGVYIAMTCGTEVLCASLDQTLKETPSLKYCIQSPLFVKIS